MKKDYLEKLPQGFAWDNLLDDAKFEILRFHLNKVIDALNELLLEKRDV